MTRYAVIGGTGTLGREIVRQLLAKDEMATIEVFSRDELKQQQMKRELSHYPGLRFTLGDVRDRESLSGTLMRADDVFHVAALKHIDAVEANPVEGLKTNVMGTVNAAQEAMAAYNNHFVFSSTDKAVHPVNVYGHTKAIGERMLLGFNGQSDTRFSVYRWGNVVGSRGSVLDVFAKSLKERGVVEITDPRMTRFLIRIEDAVSFMLKSYRSAATDEVMIPAMKAATVMRLGEAVARNLGVKDYEIKIVGIRTGEKLHELIRPDLSSDEAEQYTDAELDALIQPILRARGAA